MQCDLRGSAAGIAQGLVEPTDIVADLVVGYSGAGKESEARQFAQLRHSVPALPYSVGGIVIFLNFAELRPLLENCQLRKWFIGYSILAPMALNGILASVFQLTDKREHVRC